MFYFATVSKSKNKETSIDMSIFESDTPGIKYGSHALNLKRANKDTKMSVTYPTNKDTSMDMSIFQSDTPGRKYGSHGLNLKRENKGTIPITLFLLYIFFNIVSMFIMC